MLGLVITTVLIAVGGLLAGSVIGLLLLFSLTPCVHNLLLPDQCVARRVLIDLYTHAPLIALSYMFAIVLASLIKRKKTLLVLLALTPGIYVALTLPVEIALSLAYG